MFKRPTFLAAVGIGYVLGARAGRERYEQIATQADRFRRDPRVRQAASDAQDFAARQAPVVKEKATAAAQQASAAAGAVSDRAGAVVGKVSGSKAGGSGSEEDLEGIDLVAAASDVPDPHDD
jgi:hypothetical protein